MPIVSTLGGGNFGRIYLQLLVAEKMISNFDRDDSVWFSWNWTTTRKYSHTQPRLWSAYDRLSMFSINLNVFLFIVFFFFFFSMPINSKANFARFNVTWCDHFFALCHLVRTDSPLFLTRNGMNNAYWMAWSGQKQFEVWSEFHGYTFGLAIYLLQIYALLYMHSCGISGLSSH